MTTRGEQETIVRWDREDQEAHLYTAYEGQAKRWTKLGYEVTVSYRDRHGTPTGWEATAEKDAVRFRRVRDGQVIRRPDHGQARPFGSQGRPSDDGGLSDGQERPFGAAKAEQLLTPETPAT